MRQHYYYIANWKMHLTPDQELDYLATHFDKLLELAQNMQRTIVICPSFLSLHESTTILNETNIAVGAQNCSSHSLGAHTGEIAAQSLRSIGCQFCIIGHSEQRVTCKTDNKEVGKQALRLAENNISPIICVGETAENQKSGRALEILEQQLNGAVELLATMPVIDEKLPVLLAYEPLGSIGSGILPERDHLEMVFTWLEKAAFSARRNINWKFIYGGSVRSSTMPLLTSIELIDGVLIGNASLDFQEFEKIVE
jgi:triosephosphate isomerase